MGETREVEVITERLMKSGYPSTVSRNRKVFGYRNPVVSSIRRES